MEQANQQNTQIQITLDACVVQSVDRPLVSLRTRDFLAHQLDICRFNSDSIRMTTLDSNVDSSLDQKDSATMKLQPLFDDTREAKAVRFLTSVQEMSQSSARAFLGSFASAPDDSSTDFVESIVVLVSTPNQAIANATMKMLETFFVRCSTNDRLSLVKADLIPRLISTLNPQSLSFLEAVDIHTNLMKTISWSVCLSTPNALRQLRIENDNEQQAVLEMILKQVLAPSETYICHLCVNRFSIMDRDQSQWFLILLSRLLEIFPYYRPTQEFILHMPVVLTIPSCLTFFENDSSIMSFLFRLNTVQREWNNRRGNLRQMWQKVQRLLKVEGFEDVIEQRLRNDRNGTNGRLIVGDSIDCNILQGMNLPEEE
ncbi:hypothetical protein BLNAU_3998 [Blattamonas nauphoetae]|uniref:Uncharacterized protein n=1 Tax=Blattamonas nauphoetae TaxID=2049346 RepID=A0ABQ9YAV9_9EUKA|nr:hypothetical protein BLNAU_3998 [Blattamonas nauphoetae]